MDAPVEEGAVFVVGQDQNTQPPGEGVTPPAPERPAILRRIDEIMSRTRPVLVDKIRRIRDDATFTYSGMTRAQIYERFNVDITGGESVAQLRTKMHLAVRLRREASSYMRDAVSRKSLLRSAYESAKEAVDAELVTSNLATTIRDNKISDKARESISRQVYTIDAEEGADVLAKAIVEVSIWESVVDDMDVTLESIKSDLMSIASENKANKV